jgi:putative N6-adenine-specific DNA methylase
MIAKNMPVGINRSFAFQDFPDYDSSLFQTIKDKALSKVFTDKKYKIFGSDIDPLATKIATQNAINA